MIDEAAEIVKGIVESIDSSIVGSYNSATGLTEFCNTKWARKGKVISKSGEEFLIDQIEYDQEIEASYLGSTIPSPELDGIIDLPSPFFISGTKIAVNNEWTKADNDLTKKTPIIWLLETMRERIFGRGDVRDREMELRIFFLDETNVAQFLTEDHRREVVFPMQKLVEEFIAAIGKDRRFRTIEDYSIRTFSRFGVEQEGGMFQNILDANLSGVELIITLTKYKAGCDPKCNGLVYLN
jgi:hypothetical protein